MTSDPAQLNPQNTPQIPKINQSLAL